jgi:carbonic anhydrase
VSTNHRSWTPIVIGAALAWLACGGWLPATSPVSEVKPAEALRRLSEGNQRYAADKSLRGNADAERRLATVKDGQHPFCTVLSCSDSRVPVELLFDQGIGDVFVVRVAGNVCDVDEIGSIEYGVDHLGTPLLVVLGHTHCGAVTAVATGAEVHGSIPALVDNIVPAVKKAQQAHPDLHGAALVPAATEANIWQSIEDLLRHSPAVCQRCREGKVKIVGALYDLENGQVKWLGEHPKQGSLCSQGASSAHAHH